MQTSMNPYMNIARNFNIQVNEVKQPQKISSPYGNHGINCNKQLVPHNYGLYDNPLLTVKKPSARPWTRTLKEIEHALASEDSRVWVDDKELIGKLTVEQLNHVLIGKKTVILSITARGARVVRLYATLGNPYFSLIGENRTDQAIDVSIFFNFNEFISKELKCSGRDARIMCIRFIQSVTGMSIR